MFAKIHADTAGTTQGWAILAALWSVPVVLLAYLCCHYEPAQSLLGLFLVEWFLLSGAWRLLCPWMGKKGVIIASQSFILVCLIQYLLVEENIHVNGNIWIWSDELRYVIQAKNVVYALENPVMNLLDGWHAASNPLYGGWSLAGWPFILGLVTRLISSNPSLQLLHAVALSLNVTFFAILMAFVFSLLPEYSKAQPWMLFLIFSVLCGDPIAYAAEARKEVMMVLSLMMVFASSLKSTQRGSLSWILIGALGMLGVLTTRPAYLPLFFIVIYLISTDRLRIPIGYSMVILFMISAIWGASLLFKLDIRGISLWESMTPKDVDVQVVNYGLSKIIYKIPLFGKIAYYLLAPFPIFPWKLLDQPLIIKAIIRSLGSLAWFFSFCFVSRAIIINGKELLKNKLFLYSSIVFVGLFGATVISGDDPRYKLPTDCFLVIMFILSYSSQGRILPPVVRDRLSGSPALKRVSRS